jgi:hypothetical protein
MVAKMLGKRGIVFLKLHEKCRRRLSQAIGLLRGNTEWLNQFVLAFSNGVLARRHGPF